MTETHGYVTGRGVFLSYDGLVAEGEGELSNLNVHSDLVELRGYEFPMDLIEGIHVAWFVRPITVDDWGRLLVGLVSSHPDRKGRQGFAGVCASVNLAVDDDINLSKFLWDLFSDFSEHFAQLKAGNKLIEKINLFPEEDEKYTLERHLIKVKAKSYSLENNILDRNILSLSLRLFGLGSDGAGMLFLTNRKPQNIDLINEETVAGIEERKRQREIEKKQALKAELLRKFSQRPIKRYGVDVTPEQEQYFIDLIQFVIEERQGALRRPVHRTEVNPEKDPYKTFTSSLGLQGIKKSSPE